MLTDENTGEEVTPESTKANMKNPRVGQRHDTAFPCPGCGYEADSTFSPSDLAAVPEDGALSLCIKCATVSIFVVGDGPIYTRRPTEEELHEIMQDRGVVESKIIVLKMILSTL